MEYMTGITAALVVTVIVFIALTVLNKITNKSIYMKLLGVYTGLLFIFAIGGFIKQDKVVVAETIEQECECIQGSVQVVAISGQTIIKAEVPTYDELKDVEFATTITPEDKLESNLTDYSKATKISLVKEVERQNYLFGLYEEREVEAIRIQ